MLQPGSDAASAGGSALLIGADDEVAFAHLGARDAQILGRIELTPAQGVAVPANELLDQHGVALFVDDDVAAAGRGLERVDVQQPSRLVTRLHAVADHVYRVGRTHAAESGGAGGGAATGGL